jgi:LPS export ABC transporter permease LptG
MPDANQSFRDVTFKLAQKMASQDVRPRIFYEGFTGRVILIGDRKANGEWADVMIADSSASGTPAIQLAEAGRLFADEERRLVNIALSNVSSYSPLKANDEYQLRRSEEEVAHIDPAAVFGDGSSIGRGFNEMTIAELDAQAAVKVAANMSPHNEIMFKQQRFAFPMACLVFAVIGVALGVNTRKDGKLAGFAIGIGVIMAYYGIMMLFEGWAKGGEFSALWARWMPNIIIGVIGIVLLVLKARGGGGRITLPGWLARRWPGGASDSGTATSTPGAGRKVVLVIRFPAFSLPRPRLMDLYVGRRYIRTVTLAFVGMLALYYIGEFIELSEKLSKGQATLPKVAEYFYYATPKFIYFVVPLATLVAVLTTMGGLTRTNELTVLRACGVSLYRTALPLIMLALFSSVLMFALEDRVMAQAERKAEVLRNEIRDRPQRTFGVANRSWQVGDNGNLYHYAVFDVNARTLHHLSIFETTRDPYRLKTLTFATQVVFDDGAWKATDGWVQTFTPSGGVTRKSFAEETLPLEEPAFFGTEQIEAEFMSYRELSEYIDRLDESGVSIAANRVELHRKVAFPLVTLVMTLIAIPFGVTTGRRGALYGIGLAVVLAVSYMLLSTLFLAFGSAASLPPALAAWAANILFAAAALTMVLTVRT